MTSYIGWIIVATLIATLLLDMLIRIKSIRRLVIRDKGLWRGWLTINDPDYRHRGVDLKLEISYGRRPRGLDVGFKIHFGDRGSETPFHVNLYLHWVAFFFSMNSPNMGEFFEEIGRGHKRDISLQTHSGQLWWKLWYDDDNGYDNHHKCDKWRNPWWWPFKDKHYRSWLCLRDGCIDLNPLDMLWGRRYYSYEDLDEREDVIGIYQFEDDFYDVTFKLQKVTRARKRGPKWARRAEDRGFEVDWRSDQGIPTQNHDWKGDNTYACSVKVDSADNWIGQAHVKLQEWVMNERKRSNYQPPADKLIQIHETDDGIIIEGSIDHISGSETLEAVKAGQIDGISLGPYQTDDKQ